MVCNVLSHQMRSCLQVQELKTPLLVKAADALLNKSKFESMRGELHNFREENSWVEDSALFYCLAELQVHCIPQTLLQQNKLLTRSPYGGV